MPRERFAGARLLVTGGTGTFGHAVVQRFLDSDIDEIRVFSRDEKKQEDMRLHYRNPKLRFFLGDVRSEQSCHDAMVGVDYVFHAAALKQVPSCEFFPLEALRTNAIGADNIMKAALDCHVKTAVLLSTDKAAYPVNAMGISKAMMEKLMVARARLTHGTSTVFCGTRYGNVMASRGSVIPLFIKQILNGTPLTVTDPNMTRFMMSIEDAVDLVLYAFTHAVSGDLFVRKAPAASISVLVEALFKVFQREVPVKVIGTRHGEKLYETLLTREEMTDAIDCGDYYRVPADQRDLNYNVYTEEGVPGLSSHDDYHSHNAGLLSVDEMADLLLKLKVVQDGLQGRMPE